MSVTVVTFDPKTYQVTTHVSDLVILLQLYIVTIKLESENQDTFHVFNRIESNSGK